jgi:hypothetical protein
MGGSRLNIWRALRNYVENKVADFQNAKKIHNNELLPMIQGDQIGRNFVYLAIVYFGQFFDK